MRFCSRDGGDDDVCEFVQNDDRNDDHDDDGVDAVGVYEDDKSLAIHHSLIPRLGRFRLRHCFQSRRQCSTDDRMTQMYE